MHVTETEWPPPPTGVAVKVYEVYVPEAGGEQDTDMLVGLVGTASPIVDEL